MRILLVFIMVGLLVFGTIGCKERETKITSGIVETVEIRLMAGDLLTPQKVYTIVTFKDGRIFIFKKAVQGIQLNKCVEFWEHHKSFYLISITTRHCN